MSESPQKPGTEAPQAADYMPPGLRALTPYIIIRGAASFIDFLKAAFDGKERLRVPRPDGSIMHADVAIGNGAVELADANDHYSSSPTDIHLYVEDCDATYKRALQAGATPVLEPVDQPWGDRWSAVKDAFGNHWYIATAGWTPGPEGIPSVQPYLHLHHAEKMAPFLEAAFGAESLGIATSPEGSVLHGTIRIGNATLEISEADAEFQPKPCHLHLYVPDSDSAYKSALNAGATSIEAPEEKPYGERAGSVKDPFGNSWFIATYLGSR